MKIRQVVPKDAIPSVDDPTFRDPPGTTALPTTG